jgi:hypothetical protein
MTENLNSAAILANEKNRSAYWNQTIRRAARYLVSRHKGSFEYVTQDVNGSTLWKGPYGHSEFIKQEALDFYGF